MKRPYEIVRRLVCGLRNESIQRRLLSESNLSLQKAVEVSTGMEAAEVSTGMEAAELNSKKISASSVTEEFKQVSSSLSKKRTKEETCLFYVWWSSSSN